MCFCLCFNRLVCSLLMPHRYDEQAALDAHFSTAEFKAFSEALKTEDLLASSLEFDEVFVKPSFGHGA